MLCLFSPLKAFNSVSKVPPLMSVLRRYEILLPSQFNDGNQIPPERLAETLSQLEARFRAVSCETQIIQGIWRQESEIYRDSLIRIFVDVADTPENREFFTQFKEQLKERFQQLEIWMTTHPIEII
jgi:hypothetical protein